MTDLPADRQQIIAQIEKALRLTKLIEIAIAQLETEYGATDRFLSESLRDLTEILDSITL